MTDRAHPSSASASSTTSRRLWPGVALLAAMLGARFGLPIVAPESAPYAMMAALAFGLLILAWWLFFSRAPWRERLGGAAIFGLALVLSRPLLHESMATAGMGFLYFVYAMPVLCAVFVGWTWIAPKLSGSTTRFAVLAALALGACGGWALVRTGGVSLAAGTHFAWRWTLTPEERLLATSEVDPDALAPSDADPRGGSEAETGAAIGGEIGGEIGAETGGATAPTPAWPGFRGPRRDGRVPGVRIATDWDTKPPVELWRRPVGPGWSSFAVDGDLFYTQEQRGEDEIVACYRVATGEPVWMHTDPTRFWEANAGPGPRATPTLDRGRVYAMGANGLLNALDARDGSVVWSRDVAADTEVPVPPWGFAGSPLVVDETVVVAAAGKLAAYDRRTGEPRWFGPDGGDGYSSPHLVTIDEVPQVLLMSRAGAVAFEPRSGNRLWRYDWEGKGRIVQPTDLGGGELLMSRGETSGIRRVAVTRTSDAPSTVADEDAGHGAGGGGSIEEHWTSRRLKPYFSDLVVHEGHAYGIDGNILAAIDLETGERAWKGGRYGGGQLLLLPDQDLLLVLSERGELVLVSATPDAHDEIAKVSALDGKTWNHPALVDRAGIGPVLLVRNAEEMAALRLATPGPAENADG